MIPRRGLILALIASIAVGSAARGASGPALSPADQALVDAAERYLDGLTNAEGRFVQTDGGGRQAEGSFWLQRPGLARFDYDPPSGLAMASDGRLVSVVNRRLKTIQNYPLGFTPLSIFLSRNIRLDRQVVVETVTASDAALSITLAYRRGAGHGRIRLDFQRSPMALAGWRLIDSRGQVVEVKLTRLERAAPKPKSFFDIAAAGPEGLKAEESTTPRIVPH
jgi:outer membrane lipoprotein-sorting protein